MSKLNLKISQNLIVFVSNEFRIFKHDTTTSIFSLCKFRYRIQQGSFDDFTIDNTTGSISIVRKLDYDKRENYRIEIVASDLGESKLNLINISLKFYGK